LVGLAISGAVNPACLAPALFEKLIKKHSSKRVRFDPSEVKAKAQSLSEAA
jgi:hypothetical protein